jgi:hypothetical protein
MIERLLRSGLRILSLGITVVGRWMAAGGYPPPATGPPVQLGIGAAIGIVGLAGMVSSHKVRPRSGGIPIAPGSWSG